MITKRTVHLLRTGQITMEVAQHLLQGPVASFLPPGHDPETQFREKEQARPLDAEQQVLGKRKHMDTEETDTCPLKN